ncbi:MAG: type I-E CRISPR-associated protein Cas5/CasD [Desulfovibrionaceae bacterium]
MARYLLFQLYGPMQAWGGVAVGEARPSHERPTRSAVLGLIACALGIRRADQDAQRALAASYGVAVRLDAPGTPFRDFHTAQVPHARKGRVFHTRRQELCGLPPGEKPGTILSVRDYHADAACTVCLWATAPNPPHALDTLRDALKRPVFALFLGRKSCPPGLPLQPVVRDAPTLAAALMSYQPGTQILALPSARAGAPVQVFWDADQPGSEPGLDPEHTFIRRDAPLSRSRWQFGERREHQGHAPLPGPKDAPGPREDTPCI